MKLVNAKYGINIEFAENKINQLVIENSAMMSELVGELYTQIQGGEGGFVLQDEDKEVKLSKYAECVLDPFSLSINSKKYLSQLYAEMSSYCNELRYELKSEIVQKLIELVDEIGLVSSYDIVCDVDVTLDTLFKLMNVRFCEEHYSLKEKLIQYITIIASLNMESLIIFVHLKSYLSEEELQEFYKIALYQKIHLLLVENVDRGIRAHESSCIIDKDLCIIEL